MPAGGYLSNLFGGASALVKQPDGGFTYTKPCPATAVVPVVDTPRDYGMYVRAAIENPGMGAGSEVLTGTMISYEDQMTQLSQCKRIKLPSGVVTDYDQSASSSRPVTGKTFTLRQVDRDEWNKILNLTGYPPQFGDVLYEGYQFMSRYGCMCLGHLVLSLRGLTLHVLYQTTETRMS